MKRPILDRIFTSDFTTRRVLHDLVVHSCHHEAMAGFYFFDRSSVQVARLMSPMRIDDPAEHRKLLNRCLRNDRRVVSVCPETDCESPTRYRSNAQKHMRRRRHTTPSDQEFSPGGHHRQVAHPSDSQPIQVTSSNWCTRSRKKKKGWDTFGSPCQKRGGNTSSFQNLN